MVETIKLLVGASSSGSPVFEEVLAEPCGSNRYRLVRSPGLALGIAAGDTFNRSSDGTFDVVERAGNLCIQMFSKDRLDSVEKAATASFARVGGRLDGRTDKELVYTVSASVGFGPIEETLRSLQAAFPNMEWYYGNVYDPADGVTPLDWWKEQPS